jgi:hypothetical protein
MERCGEPNIAGRSSPAAARQAQYANRLITGPQTGASVTASEADIAQILNLEILLHRKVNWFFRIVVFRLVVTRAALLVLGISSLEQDIKEGENPVCYPSVVLIRVNPLMSRVVWDCSLKWVVDLIQS